MLSYAVKDALNRMHAQISIYCEDGRALMPLGGAVTLPTCFDGIITRQEGYTFVHCGAQRVIVCVKGEDHVAGDYALLASELIKADSCIATRGAQEQLFSALNGELSAERVHSLAKEHRFSDESAYCVIVIDTKGVEKVEMLRLFDTVMTGGGGDMTVDMGNDAFAIIKTLDGETDYADMDQLSGALCQSIADEHGVRAFVGLSDAHKGAKTWAMAYAEAKKSIEVGRVYAPEQGVFTYRTLLLERFLSDIPSPLFARYHDMLFNQRARRIFDDEMMRTVDVFLNNHLNLAEAARQLYVHRNTLVYRLDKIQRVTGLDLRTFRDAMTLKIMLMGANHKTH